VYDPDVLWRILASFALAACAARAEAPRPPPPAPPAEEDETEPDEPQASTGACAPDMAHCPLDGCASPGSPHASLNRAKRTTTTAAGERIRFADATPISIEHMRRLQIEADRALPKRADRAIEDRRVIERFDLGDCAIGEGTAVRLAGYIAPSGHSNVGAPGSAKAPTSRPKPQGVAGPHEGSVESVNCRLGTSANVDIHIPITAAAKGEDECHGVVVEMIPQGRDVHPGWNLATLHDLAKKRRLVLFVGRLFYDNEHLVRPDCSASHVQQPKRASLWEVHPVVEMYVCKDDTCTADSARGWMTTE
jgi:hypothetical protein